MVGIGDLDVEGLPDAHTGTQVGGFVHEGQRLRECVVGPRQRWSGWREPSRSRKLSGSEVR